MMFQENGNWADVVCKATTNFLICEKETTAPPPTPPPIESEYKPV
jgi:hypothetical protein